MTQIVLPPQYYRTHFFEMMDFVEEHYRNLFEPRELQFISDFKNLSESAQCVFVRMVNRKGSIFDRKAFAKYGEIENQDAAWAELENKKFVRGPLEHDRAELIAFLTKPQLLKWLQASGIPVQKSASREEIANTAFENRENLKISFLTAKDLAVQQKTAELEYILFLFFGSIQRNLTLYTLRDLGIRQSQTLKTRFVPRFSNQTDAQTEYFFAKALHSWFEFSDEEIENLRLKAISFKNLTKSSQNLKNDLMLELGDHWVEENPNRALECWSLSLSAKAREKSARLLYKLDRKPECQSLLEEILQQPRNDEELLFAEDFSLRKFNKKRKSTLTEVLEQAREISLSDFYLKRPEVGVCAYLAAQGQQASFCENSLWSSLFGVLFWSELFESDQARIHNPFERSPSDLVGPEFYQNQQLEIEAKLALFQRPQQLQMLILQTVSSHYGKLNDLFRWHENLGRDLISFVKKCVNRDLPKILRALAQNYETHHVGFPDLMVEKENEIHFIEVKAEGDSLRPGQLSRLRLLQEAGFSVEVLRVRWESDPNQIYVVVDVETTGGQAAFHRITEIGAVKIQNGQIIDEFQTLIQPGRSIPAFISQLTGITNEMVKEAPTFSEIAEKFLEFLEGAVFVAHNVKFDYSFIQREFQRAGHEFVRPQLCTCAGMRKTHPGLSSYGLKNLTSHFEIALEQHHRALSDARAAAQLLLIMNGQRRGETIPSEMR